MKTQVGMTVPVLFERESSPEFHQGFTPNYTLIKIPAKKSEKSAIMKSIIENAGSKTPAHAVVFSLPVDEVVGLAALANDD